MKLSLKMLVGFINLPKLCLFYVIMLVFVIPEVHGVSVKFGIPETAVAGGIDQIVFAKWMVMMSIPLIVNGIIIEKSRQIESFSRLRMKRKKDYIMCVEITSSITVIIWAGFLAVSTACMNNIRISVSLFFLASSNFLVWTTLQLVTYYCSKNIAWSSLGVVLLNGVGCLVGICRDKIFPYIPSAWGMLCRSTVMKEKIGFRMPYIYMVLMNLLFAAIGVFVLNKIGEE